MLLFGSQVHAILSQQSPICASIAAIELDEGSNINAAAVRVIQLGAYPPPYGGISSHVKRLDAVCRRSGIASKILDFSGIAKFVPPGVELVCPTGTRGARLFECVRFLERDKPDIVHFHLSGMANFLYAAMPLLMATRKSKRVATLHSGSFAASCASLAPPPAYYLRAILSHFDHIIAVNVEQKTCLVRDMRVPQSLISVLPAFLPPDVHREPMHRDLAAFFSGYEHSAIICGFARPHYGFHTAIRAMDLLRDVSLGLIVNLYTAEDKEYKRQIQRMVEQRPSITISENISNEAMASVLQRVDIFLRGTSMDGDSVALREAAFFQRQVIATTCVSRPEGCLLYPHDDEYALALRIREALADRNAGRVKELAPDGGAKILDVYRLVSSTFP